jgi:glycosyltransferase involved in cell wall biosynthesis
VEVLLAAFARARKKRTFRLVIAGPDNTPVYGARLRAQAKALGVEREVTFLGPVFGPEKGRLFRQAWAFCLPSHSEVVGLVNLEAAAAGVPVITTFETGLDDWEEGGGLLVHPQVEDLARVLEQVCSWSDSERQQRGRRMRQWVERRYSWEVVGPLWLQLYEEIAAKGYRGK